MTDLDTRRAEIFAEVAARITMNALPAPTSVSPQEDGSLWLKFDSYEEAERWTEYFNVEPFAQVYKPDWQDTEIRSMNTEARGTWHGWHVFVTGWSDAEAVAA